MSDSKSTASIVDDAFAPEERFGNDYSRLLLEQYKIFVDTSTKVSERRATMQTFFLSANTLLATVYGLAQGREGGSAGAWQWLIPLAGFVLALSWLLLIQSYSSLNSAKFQVIGELEKRLPAQLFTLEWQFIGRSVSGSRYVPLNRIERLIPLVFSLFFAGLFAHALWPSLR